MHLKKGNITNGLFTGDTGNARFLLAVQGLTMKMHSGYVHRSTKTLLSINSYYRTILEMLGRAW